MGRATNVQSNLSSGLPVRTNLRGGLAWDAQLDDQVRKSLGIA